MAGPVAVIDIGKTHAKIGVVEAGALVEQHQTPTPFMPAPPYPHLDVDTLFAWICDTLAEIARTRRLAAIVPTAYGSTAALISESGLVLPVMDYEAAPPRHIIEGYAEIAPEFAEVFAPTNPAGLTLARQLFWQQSAFAEQFSKVKIILTAPQFWAWKLTGVAASEITSLGAQTHLWAPRKKSFSSLARQRGWNALMPPRRAAWAPLGPLLPDLQARLGVGQDVPVLCGIHDSNANYLRYLAGLNAPFTLLSTGTWIIGFNAQTPLERLDAARDTVANIDVEGRPVAASRFMGGREFELVAGPGNAAASLADIGKIIAQQTFALPSFTDSGGPMPGTGGKGCIVGSQPISPGERAALATLYVALMISASLDAIGSDGPIIVDGPFARAPAFLAVLAALRPAQTIDASVETQGTTLGAALLPGWPDQRYKPNLALRRQNPGDLPGITAYATQWRTLAEAIV
ncbi:MAG: FGGY-family carbohydrate kinase [Alphaproteobacteria bacterium]